MLEAQRQVREQREEEERERRRQIEAQAHYHTLDVDPFGKNAQGNVRKKKKGARMLFGKFRGTLVEDVPTWYLESCMSGKPFISVAWLRAAIKRELGKR